MFLKKVFLGISVAMLIVFGAAIPAYASMAPEDVKVEGTVQTIDFVAGTFTLLTEDGSLATVDAPDGFDLTLLLPGSFVEAKGTAGLDDVINANEIEMQDGSEFEVEDENDSDDVNDDHGGDDEFDDDSQDDLDDDSSDDLDEDVSQDDHGGDSGNSGSSHDEDDDHSGSGSSGSDSIDSEDD